MHAGYICPLGIMVGLPPLLCPGKHFIGPGVILDHFVLDLSCMSSQLESTLY